MDCGALTAVPSPKPQRLIIRTNMASQHSKEIFLDRFQKEIVERLQFSLSSSSSSLVHSYRHDVLKQRIRIGTNTCSRVLEAACYRNGPVPLLVVVAAEDLSPVTPLVNIPVLTDQLKVPLLLLPGSACFELGRTLRVSKVSIIIFMPSDTINGCSEKLERDDSSDRQMVDSFVDFVISKIALKKA
jgi:hypothetical protein